MSLNKFQMGTGLDVATDMVSAVIGGKTYTLHRQVVVLGQAAEPSIAGYPAGQAFQAALASTAPSEDLSVDGSATPVNFNYQVGAAASLLLERIAVTFRGVGTYASGGFGKHLSALTNGLLFTIRDSGGTVVATLFGGALKTNTALARAGDWSMPFPDVARVVFDLTRGGVGVYLPASHFMRATVQDDLTGAADDIAVAIAGRLA